MRLVSFVAVLAAARLAHAEVPERIQGRADAPDGDATDITRLTLGDGIVVSHRGVTAAFSVDPDIVEVSARAGQVTLEARGVGSTTISLVTPTEIVSLQVTVVAPASSLATALEVRAPRRWTLWQGQYESSTARVTNSLEMVDGNDHRTLRAYAVNVVRLDEDSSQDDDARTSLPALALEWRTKRHEVVLFDKTIEQSPLTLDGTIVRGAHLRTGGLQLHAGITSPVLYQNVFLSKQGEVVLGASYEMRAGRSSLTPNVYAYPSAPQTGGTDGTMASLLYRYRSPRDRLQLAVEAGWGGVFGAAGELGYQGPRHRAWIKARYQPRGFAALGIGRPLGSMFDAMWAGQPTKRLSMTAATTAARYQHGDQAQDVATATTEARVSLTRRLATSAGVSVGRFANQADPEPIYSLTLPLGLHVDGAHGGVSGTYRYQRNTARDLGGHGGRLSARAHAGAFYASAFVDAQQEAASVELVLKEEPALAQLLSDMGLTASTPDELARVLRENAILSQLGYADGATLELDPWRVQAGADLAYLTRDKTNQQLRLRLLVNRTQTITDREETVSATLSYGRRIADGVDATGMMSWWSRAGEMTMAPDAWSVAAGLRVRLDSVPRLGSPSVRELSGVVVSEDDEPLAGVAVRLDRSRTATTDAQGRFRFASVTGGAHDVEADLPDDSYFISASRVSASAGDPVRFVLARAAARVTGTIVDDAGNPVGGIAVELRSATSTRRVTASATGQLRFAVPSGEYVLAPIAETVPAGYDATQLVSQTVHVQSSEPTQVVLVLPANRSIAGRVHSMFGEQPAEVRLVELGRIATIDAAGRYVFRGLPPGTHTIEAIVDGVIRRRVVQLPAQPTSLRDVDFP